MATYGQMAKSRKSSVWRPHFMRFHAKMETFPKHLKEAEIRRIKLHIAPLKMSTVLTTTVSRQDGPRHAVVERPWGLTEVAVWIMRQGVRLLFNGIRHPHTQGKVERMHGALQQAMRKRRADPLQQTWLDMFRQEYNHIRPHTSLDMATPASRWHPVRAFQSAPPDWEYPPEMQVLRLAGEGQLAWAVRRWDIGRALRRQSVGPELMGDRATGSSFPSPLT
jgi:hypothetical protein